MTALMTAGCRCADSPDILAAIREEGCNLAIWRRLPIADFTPLTEGTPPDLRFETSPAAVARALPAALAEAGFAAPELHAPLAADVARIAGLFCAAMRLARFELRLELVRTDSCRKFHADYVTARLITTYAGAGTEWIDDADAARVAAGQEPRRINRMNAFDVGLFKGRTATKRPAIHRSPPIAATGGKRLLLVLNPAIRQFVDSPDSAFSGGREVA
ncbi:DUF1826 domain-containing protein [Erythrobacter tepidarius]|uniref:DUF1826 domain-containing protein n=1 Tax=Erythrobacter tepidarius TaxID=60454 RepID=UPI000A387176|nr:DUF1826 domain-containing protein [Erythrobacter tepidarius]